MNDAGGHAAGDRVLVQVALALQRSVRSVDTAARLDGDEFCVLAPFQTAATGAALATRLAAAVGAETINVGEGTGASVSIGVVAAPEHGEDPRTLLEAADTAMYQAKARGGTVAIGALDDMDELEKTEG